MNKNEKGLWIFAIALMLAVVVLASSLHSIQNRIIALEINHMFSLDSRSYPGNQLDSIKDKLETQEYKVNQFDDWFWRMDAIEEKVDYLVDRDILHEIVSIFDPATFPYVDQVGEDAQYKKDCGSAAILMIAKYYGVAGDETVDFVHMDMMHGDYPSTFVIVAEYLESRYGLETEIVTTFDQNLPALEELGFDISEIKLVKDIPHDKPVIWVYSFNAHWVVRYQGWSFDPRNGIFLFNETEVLRGIRNPELGLGIIVISE